MLRGSIIFCIEICYKYISDSDVSMIDMKQRDNIVIYIDLPIGCLDGTTTSDDAEWQDYPFSTVRSASASSPSIRLSERWQLLLLLLFPLFIICLKLLLSLWTLPLKQPLLPLLFLPSLPAPSPFSHHPLFSSFSLSKSKSDSSMGTSLDSSCSSPASLLKVE